jgi:hypothetical protein
VAELSIEQRRALALASARLRAQETESAGQGSGFMPFVNRSISSIVGAPVDLMNAGLGAVGLPVSPQPFGGSASIEAGLTALGRAANTPMVPQPGQQAQTPAEYIGRGVGEAAGALIPGFGAARVAAQAANPVVAGIGRRISAAPVAAPVGTTSLELASGAGAGAGRMVAEENFPNNAAAGTMGELVGGLGVGAVPSIFTNSLTALAAREAKRAFLPFTQSGSEARAGRRLAGLVPDPNAAADAATAPSIGNLTPAQRTGDVRLLALERAVADADPVIAQRLRERAAASEATLLEEARGLGGDPAATRRFLESRRERLETALEQRVEQARATAQQRIAALEPNAPAETASRIVREEFDNAYQAAMAQERELWRAIPQDVQIDTAPLFARFAEIQSNTPRTQQHDIPDYAREFLSPDGNRRLGATESPAELQGLRSELLDVARRADAAGERNRARLARELADATLDAMNSLPETAGPYAVARDFTRNLSARFRDGEVGILTRKTPDGQPRVAPEMTLPSTVGRGGPAGGVAARELAEATGDSARARDAVEDFLRRSFRDSAVNADGRMRPDAATNWMRRNDQLSEQFPDLRRGLAEALAAQRAADVSTERQATVGRNLRSPRSSAVARYLEADYGEEVARVFAAQNPADVAASLRRSVARDDTGQALAGLQGAFVDNLISRARQTTPDGSVLRGSVILDALNDPKQAGALRAVFDPDQMQRLRQIGTELNALERARGGLPSVGAPMDDLPNKVIEIVGRIVAARVGAATGGAGMAGSLQSAQMMSSRMRDFLRRLTNDRASVLLADAVTDPKLFAALMAPARSIRQQDEAAMRLQAWLAGPTGRAVAGEDREEQGQGPRLGRALLSAQP